MDGLHTLTMIKYMDDSTDSGDKASKIKPFSPPRLWTELPREVQTRKKSHRGGQFPYFAGYALCRSSFSNLTMPTIIVL
eukprot:913824-Pelagomonas_calceolata.AAC.3